MTYRNARLIVGTLNVAVVLFLCGLALKESIPVRLFPKNEITVWPHILSFIQTFVFFGVVSCPFDLLGGLVLPWVYKRDFRGLVSFLANWIRSTVIQATVAIGSSVLMMGYVRHVDAKGEFTAIGVLMGLLIVFREYTSPLRGGAKWNRTVRLKDPLAALIWNFGGVILASRYSEVSLLSAAGIVTLGIYVSLWSFLGVLVVPLFLGERSSRVHQMILFPSWVCFGFLSRCLPSVLGLAEYWITGKDQDEND